MATILSALRRCAVPLQRPTRSDEWRIYMKRKASLARLFVHVAYNPFLPSVGPPCHRGEHRWAPHAPAGGCHAGGRGITLGGKLGTALLVAVQAERGIESPISPPDGARGTSWLQRCWEQSPCRPQAVVGFNCHSISTRVTEVV